MGNRRMQKLVYDRFLAILHQKLNTDGNWASALLLLFSREYYIFFYEENDALNKGGNYYEK